jgi:adenosylmethionine-8-amino-7-oxononanoate aminotransferase
MDVLFIADEVITGFGRTGDWFASNRFGLDPDIITCAKGITSGYLPMGAVIASPAVAEPFFTPGAGLWRHGYTYSGHASVAAAALANLDIMEREDLCGRALKLESALFDALAPLADHDLVEEVRGGVGVLAAVNLRQDLVTEDASLPAKVGGACREAGMLIRPLVGGALAVSPPLVIDDEGIAEMAEAFRAGLDAVEAS